jgi:hypothetical protein
MNVVSKTVIPSSREFARESASASIARGFVPEIDQRTPAWLIATLEEAGRTLLALPVRGTRPSEYGNGWPDVVHEAIAAYGWATERCRAAYPTAQQIARMDEVYNWIGLIPESKRLLRRIVLLRSLVHPVTDRHIFSWRKIATKLGHDDKTTKGWHESAIISLLVEIDGLQLVDK